MSSYKAPSFSERAADSAAAKQRALDKLKSKPPIDPAIVAERAAAAERRAAREAEQAERRAARIQAERDAKEEAARKAQEEAEAAEAARKAKIKPVLSEAERKAIRDARYAARKARR